MIRARPILLLAVFGVAIAWVMRGVALAGIGSLLVSEDSVETAEWVVLSGASPRATGLEGLYLYRQAVAKQLLVVVWGEDPLQDQVEALGIPQQTPNELIMSILVKGGIPDEAVTLVKATVNGTESETRVVADFANRENVASLLYVTTRTHTARARHLLRRRVRDGTRVFVRAPRLDAFSPGAWWKHRDQARDVMAEYLRWLTSLLSAAPWGIN